MPGLVLRHLSRGLSLNHSSDAFNILFFGQDEFSCTIFRRLHASKDLWREIWVATNPDAKTGRRGKEIAVSPLNVLARSLDVTASHVPPKHVGLRNWEVPGPFSDTCRHPRNILITASFGRVIPVSILNLFGHSRRLNVHPSLVPLYRGPAPIQHAIADGKKETGISILNLEPVSKGMDSGDVWASRAVDIPSQATFNSLRETLAEEGADLLVSALRAMAAETAVSVSQDSAKATLAPFIKRSFTQINWDTWDAHRLDRVHRAAHHQHALVTLLPYSPTLQIEEFTVRSPPAPLHPKLAEPGDSIYDPSTQSIIIRCAGQTEVSATLLQQENKRVLGANDFWNGVRPEGFNDGLLRLCSFPP